ncbi:hypothetical protein S40293_03619 [Stachybotrys chartarum IBT 40293]|nr:hypothetical protein S40293_03619 [Stachybotrys chartarum IBT 40293]
MSTNRSALRRRNGRLQACDPCRGRKVACDHSQPVCLRCRKRGQLQDCVYTITDGLDRLPRAASQNNLERVEEVSPQLSSITAAAIPSTRPTSVTRSRMIGVTRPTRPSSSLRSVSSFSNPTPSGTDNTSLRPVNTPRGPGYLGFTSHSAVYQETSHSLSRLQGTHTVHGSPAATIGQGSSSRTNPTLTPETRQTCRTVLQNLTILKNLKLPPSRGSNVRDGWSILLANRIHQYLLNYLEEDSDDGDAKLDRLGWMLCENTSRPLDEDAACFEEWMAKYTGTNLRWESIGLLFTLSDQIPQSQGPITDGARHEHRRSPSRRFALRHIDLCIGLSRTFTDGSLLLLHVCHRRSILKSMADGDASLSCWTAHAETVALLTFMGLHVEQDTSSYVPTFTSELRRRLCAHIFNIDKVAVSFQGRPPLLCYRYMSIPMPLDIPEEDFLGDAEAFKKAVIEVDEDGWSSTGTLSATTLTRARTMIACIWDELIDVALSIKKSANIETVLAIKAKAHNILNDIPQSIQYRDEYINDYSIHFEIVYACLIVRVEYLQNILIAERLLHLQGGHTDDGELLLTSFEMVGLTLKVWIHKDRFAEAIEDFEWLVMNYAAPGGGILSMELLRPTFSGPHHPRNPNLTRSAIIQRLSLLVAFLGWVGPDAAHADLCVNCQNVIQHVLDHTLNNGGAQAMPQDAAQTHQQQQAVNDATMGEFMDGEGFNFGLDLLDTFSWLRTDDLWMAGGQETATE